MWRFGLAAAGQFNYSAPARCQLTVPSCTIQFDATAGLNGHQAANALRIMSQ